MMPEPDLADAKDTPHTVDLLNDLAWRRIASDPSEALALSRQALAMARQLEYPAGVATSQLNLGRCQLRMTRYADALAALYQALAYFEATAPGVMLSRTLRMIGAVYRRMANYSESLKFQLRALQVARTLADKMGETAALNNLGSLFHSLAEYEKALDALQQALPLCRELGASDATSSVLNNLALTIAAQGEYTAALPYARESLQLARQAGLNTADVLDTLGQIHLGLGELVEAEEVFEQCVTIARQTGARLDEVEALLNLGRVAQRRWQADRQQQAAQERAWLFAEQALALSETHDAQTEVAACHQLLATLAEEQGQALTALTHFKAFHAIQKQIFDQESERRFKWLQLQHENESVRREAEIFRLKNAELELEIQRRRQVEARLRTYHLELEARNAELKKLSQAVAQSASMIMITNPQGRIEYVNPSFEEVTGYAESEVIGRDIALLASGEGESADLETIWQTVKSGRAWRGEFFNRRRDGSTFWDQSTIAPITDDSGQVTHFVAVKEDISAQKQAAEALRQYANQLEARNAELDAFAHTVAHDLKSPLTTLVGFCELMVDDLDTFSKTELQHYLQIAVERGLKISNIVNELLLLASVRGMHEVKVTSLNMDRLIHEAIKRLDQLIGKSGTTIHRPQAWPAALGYGPWIEEVWVNYISNGIKYGGTPPVLQMGAERQTNGAIRFWLRDNGNGLPPERREQIFTPFERLHNVRAEGHGLGLSIVRRIVEKLGGEVGFESWPDGGAAGSIFFFTLPAADFC